MHCRIMSGLLNDNIQRPDWQPYWRQMPPTHQSLVIANSNTTKRYRGLCVLGIRVRACRKSIITSEQAMPLPLHKPIIIQNKILYTKFLTTMYLHLFLSLKVENSSVKNRGKRKGKGKKKEKTQRRGIYVCIPQYRDARHPLQG